MIDESEKCCMGNYKLNRKGEIKTKGEIKQGANQKKKGVNNLSVMWVWSSCTKFLFSNCQN